MNAPTPRAIELTPADGVPLTGRVFETAREADMTVLMLPGIGVPQRMFRHVAAWLSARGARCLTVDYRGIGESRTAEAATATATLLNWARLDAVAALACAETRWPEPVVLLGHSFGGQLLGLEEAFRRVRAVVLVGSQLGQPRHWDGMSRLKLMAYWNLVLPVACALFETLPAAVGFGTRLPRGVAQEWSRWGRSPEWFLSCEPTASEVFAAFDRPLLAYAIEDDPIAPPRAAAALLERFPPDEVTKREVTPSELGLAEIGHTGFFRPGPTERLWQESLEFFRRRL